MDSTRKKELLDQQIADANNGFPADFESWRHKTDAVLRTVLGEGTPLHKSFSAVGYSPMVWYEGMDTSNYQPSGVRSVIAILESAKMEVDLAAEVDSVVDAPKSAAEVAPNNRVFIVHGHDDATKYNLARFLADATGEEPVILHEQANRGRVLIEKFEQSAASTGYAVILLTADDLGRAKAETDDRPRGRQNVVFEMGFFFGAFGRQRVAVLYEEGVETIGDITGLVYIPLDSAGGWKAKVAKELADAGLTVDWSALGR